MASLGELVADMVLNTARFTAPLGEAEYKLDKFVKDTRKNITQLATGIAAVFTVSMFADGIKGALDFGDALDEAAQKTGASATAMGGLQEAAKKSGVDANALTNSMVKLNLTMVKGMDAGSDQAKMFDKLGVSIVDSEGKMKSTDKVMLELADKFKGMADGAQKNALAVELMSKAGTDMIPVLNAGSEALEQQIQDFKDLTGMTDEQAKASGEFNDKLDTLALQAKGFWMQLTAQLLPALNSFVDWISKSAKEGGTLATVVQGVAGFIKVLTVVVVAAVEGFVALGKTLGTVMGAFAEWQRGGSILSIWQGLKDGMADATKGLGNVKTMAIAAFTEPAAAAAAATTPITTHYEATAKGAKKVVDQLDKMAEKYEELAFAQKVGLSPATVKQFRDLGELYDKGKISLEEYTIAVEDLVDKDTVLTAQQKLLNDEAAAWNQVMKEAKEATDKYNKTVADAADKQEKYFQSLRDTNDRLRDEGKLIGLSGTARDLANSKLERERELRKDLDPLVQDYVNKIYDERDALISARGASEDYNAAMNDVANSLSGVVGEALDAFISKGTKGFGDMWDSFKRWGMDAVKQFAQKQITMSIMGLFSGSAAASGGGGGVVDSLMGMFGGGGGAGGGLMSMFGDAGSLLSTGLSAFGGIGSAVSAASAALATTAGNMALAAGATASTALGVATAASAVIPVVGWVAAAALIAYQVFGQQKGGPKVGGAAGSALGGADVFPGETGGAGNTSAQKVITNLDKSYTEILKRLGGTGTGAFGMAYDTDPEGTANNRMNFGASVNGRNVYLYRSGDDALGKDPKVMEAAIALESQRALLAALQASDMPSQIARVLNSVTASAASEDDINNIVAAGEAVGNLMEVLEGFKDPVQAVTDAMALPSTAYGQWKAQGEALRDLASTVPATTEGLNDLNVATQGYWKTTVELVGAIMQAKAALADMFADTRESIITSTMDPAQLLAREQQKMASLVTALDAATDPDDIARIAGQIDASMNKIWGMLSPEEQKAAQADFLSQLDALQAQADAKLNASLEIIRAQTTSDRQVLQETLDRLVDGIAGAGVDFSNGAQVIADTAANGINVTVVIQPEMVTG